MGKDSFELVKNLTFLLIALYAFLLSIKLIEESFRMFGSGFAEQLISFTTNPFVGLFIGILSTSILQSSSCTTSIVVGLVAGGGISVRNAVPIIMGANIGTTVTNMLVSLGHVTRRHEFGKAFSGAIIHDIFNVLIVVVLLPIELYTHFLEHAASHLADTFVGVGGLEFVGPLKILVSPVVGIVRHITFHSPVVTLALALILLFIALRYIVKIMRSLVMKKMEVFLDRYLFKTALSAFALGLIFTAIIQSSSVTTSIVVPLVGAGILTVEKIFPYVLGANVGTTVTAILASFVVHSKAAVTVAFVHLLFNVVGILILYPLRFLPINLAKKFAIVARDRRWMAILYIITAFYLIPVMLIFLMR
jgi:sodium-dependent phosphate cotransporter